MKFPYKSGLILLLFLVTISTIQENSNVYPARLRTQTDCELFRKQKKFKGEVAYPSILPRH